MIYLLGLVGRLRWGHSNVLYRQSEALLSISSHTLASLIGQQKALVPNIPT